MAQTLTFTIKFSVEPPNVQQALDAVNSSLKNVGVCTTNVGETTFKVNALDDAFTKLIGPLVHAVMSVIFCKLKKFAGL